MIASFRMYEATPAAAAAWRALFERVFGRARVDMRIVEHRWPQPIAALWGDPDLGCAFMCGWPFVRAAPPMQAIAVPVPAPMRYGGLPRYCSEFLVRATSGWSALEETFGHRFGWMAQDSQSGFNAPRAHLAGLVTGERPSLYAEVIGPLGSPAAALEALAAGGVDVVALDSFYLDLCRHHDPARLAGLACVATTSWAPIPLLVAAPAIDREVVARLREVLCTAHQRPDLAACLEEVLVSRFRAPPVSAYQALQAMAATAVTAGYPAIR